MSGEERYNILKDAKLIAVTDKESSKYREIQSLAGINRRAKSIAEKYVFDLAKTLNILNLPLTHSEVSFEITISKSNGLRESVFQQTKYGGDYLNFGKALVNLKEILEQSVVVFRSNEDVYQNTKKAEMNFETKIVTFGAFETHDSIVPVKLEIKKQTDVRFASLYLVVSLTEIKKSDVMVRESSVKTDGNQTVTGSVYSLAQIISLVNSCDADFLKYVPDRMLTAEQLDAKRIAIEKDNYKIKRLGGNGIVTY